MFSHIMIGANDLDRAKSFYDKLLGSLGVPPAMVDGHRIFYMTPTGIFGVSKPINGEPATHANGGTIGFACKSPEQSEAGRGWMRRLEAGGHQRRTRSQRRRFRGRPCGLGRSDARKRRWFWRCDL